MNHRTQIIVRLLYPLPGGCTYQDRPAVVQQTRTHTTGAGSIAWVGPTRWIHVGVWADGFVNTVPGQIIGTTTATFVEGRSAGTILNK